MQITNSKNICKLKTTYKICRTPKIYKANNFSENCYIKHDGICNIFRVVLASLSGTVARQRMTQQTEEMTGGSYPGVRLHTDVTESCEHTGRVTHEPKLL